MTSKMLFPKNFHWNIQRLHLVAFALLPTVVQSTSCWPHDITNEAVVGIEIGLTHGTSVIAFPNGTFISAISLEADKTYQDWIYRSLYHAINYQNHGYIIENAQVSAGQSHVGVFNRFVHWISVSSQTRLQTEQDLALDETIQTALQSLLINLKADTEALLGSEVSNITVVLPSFFNYTQKKRVYSSINAASLHSISCPNLEDSSVTATLFERHVLHHYFFSRGNLSNECAFGPSGAEHVVVAEYTGNVLIVSIFELQLGRKIWVQRGLRRKTFVALKTPSTVPTDNKLDTDTVFWETTQKEIRSLLPRHVLVGNWTIRLILKGPNSRDPLFLNLLSSSLGETIPSPSEPRAVRISLSREELEKNSKAEMKRAMPFTCLYRDYSNEWLVKRFEEGLLKLVDSPVDNWAGDIGFTAAGGAALLGLEMKGRKLSCGEWDDAVGGFNLDLELDMGGIEKDEL